MSLHPIFFWTPARLSLDVCVEESGYDGLGVSPWTCTGWRKKGVADGIPIVTIAHNVKKVGGGEFYKDVSVLNSSFAAGTLNCLCGASVVASVHTTGGGNSVLELGLLDLLKSGLNILETLLAFRLGPHKTRSMLQVLSTERVPSCTETLADVICTLGDEADDFPLDRRGAFLGEVSEALAGLSHYGTLLVHIGLRC